MASLWYQAKYLNLNTNCLLVVKIRNKIKNCIHKVYTFSYMNISANVY